jgi:S1-C subfamily serine protease
MPRKQTFKHKNGTYAVTVCDGNGRIQNKWNATQGRDEKYLKSGEPAYFNDVSVINDPYFEIKRADGGQRGDSIEWNEHITISKNGNVGIGILKATEKLDVDGNIKCDAITTDSLTLNGTTITSFDNINDTVATSTTSTTTSITSTSDHVPASDVYNIVKDAVVTLTILKGNSVYSGSAFFISSDGWLATASHNLLGSSRNDRAEKVLATITNYNGNDGTHKFVVCGAFYVDGAGDVGLIRVPNISGHTYLSFRDDDLDVGTRCFLVGNPKAVDMQSISEGVVRDPHYTDVDGDACTDNVLIDGAGYGGNSGSPIVDDKGQVIGIYTFGFSGTEALGGGPNITVAGPVLNWMMTNTQDYTAKRYLNIRWSVLSGADIIISFPSRTTFNAQGIVINSISTSSPLYSAGMREEDIILSIDGILIGAAVGQFTPTKATWLIKSNKTMAVEYFDYTANTIKIVNVDFNQNFDDIPSKDVPLAGNSTFLVENKIKDMV